MIDYPQPRPYTQSEAILATAFSKAGMRVMRRDVPMNKWKCVKCHRIWSEGPPPACPKCGVMVEQISHQVSLLVNGWAAVGPGSSEGISKEDRDKALRENKIEPFDISAQLVDAGAWLIVDYIKLLDERRHPKMHELVIKGRVQHLIQDGTELLEDAPVIHVEANADITVKMVKA